MADGPRPFLGLMAGVAAGLVAAAAMSALQARAAKRADDDDMPSGDGQRDALLVEPEPQPTSPAMRYVVGGVLGGIYGLIAEYRPEASSGFGNAYGIAAGALLDDGALDASLPEEASPLLQAASAATPLIFGVVLEGIRRLFAGRPA